MLVPNDNTKLTINAKNNDVADDLCVSFHDDYSDFVDELKAIVDIAQVYV